MAKLHQRKCPLSTGVSCHLGGQEYACLAPRPNWSIPITTTCTETYDSSLQMPSLTLWPGGEERSIINLYLFGRLFLGITPNGLHCTLRLGDLGSSGGCTLMSLLACSSSCRYFSSAEDKFETTNPHVTNHIRSWSPSLFPAGYKPCLGSQTTLPPKLAALVVLWSCTYMRVLSCQLNTQATGGCTCTFVLLEGERERERRERGKRLEQ